MTCREEQIYVHPSTRCEVYAMMRSGRVEDLYAYKDAFFLSRDRSWSLVLDARLGETSRREKLTFETRSNPLFVHAVRPQESLDALVVGGFYGAGADVE